MRITVNHLRRIIKEEVQNVMGGGEFIVQLDGNILPPTYNDGDPAAWRRTKSKFDKIGAAHGVKWKMVGPNSVNPYYGSVPAFQTEAEAQALADDLGAAGIDASVFDTGAAMGGRGSFWG